MTDAPTVLVSMPFYPALRPCLQIGLLAAIGRKRGFTVKTLHLNLDLMAQIGVDLYEALVTSRELEIGNWLFAKDAFRDELIELTETQLFCHPKMASLFDAFEIDRSTLYRMRQDVIPEFLRRAENAIDWSRYRIVGFTSTFQQNTASLALARRLKERFPKVVILFGGANFEGEMGSELVRACDWIDLAVDGEADEVFPEILEAVARGEDPTAIPGVVSRKGVVAVPRKPFTGLNDLPIPDFDEFFERAEKLAVLEPTERNKIRLPFETSRGCWWGQKHHCTFCGLNGGSMDYRHKSAERIILELKEQAKRYQTTCFDAVDNIMPLSAFKNLIPSLISDGSPYSIFFEVKANLSRQQVKALGDAGIRHIQPGIESMSTRVLKLMKKGSTATQNVNLLRWALYYGIDVQWNLLWGFPGEHSEDYVKQADLCQHLVHLQPPAAYCRIWLERFSPLFKNDGRQPMRKLEPVNSLSFIYPEYVDLRRVAYFFDHEFEDELSHGEYLGMIAALSKWQLAWKDEFRPKLTYRISGMDLVVEDHRKPGADRVLTFGPSQAYIYQAISERPLSVAGIEQQACSCLTPREIANALEHFIDCGLVMQDGDIYLALAVPSADGELIVQ